MANTAALLALVAALSAGDVSVSDQAIKQPGAQVMTIPGSANDAFWSELVRQGWMIEEAPPDGLKGVTKVFTFTDSGRKNVPALLHRRK